jgi:hypothetical protein
MPSGYDIRDCFGFADLLTQMGHRSEGNSSILENQGAKESPFGAWF